jgi:hypothetical protein
MAEKLGLLAASSTQYEALREARDRATATIFVPTGRVGLRKAGSKSVLKKAAATKTTRAK